jgi:hypothetical protein
VSLQIIISLEVLLHYFWETHVFFFKMFFFQLETRFIFEVFVGKELLYYKTQCSLKCCSILAGSFEKYMPFSRCLLQLGNAGLFEIKCNSCCEMYI